MTNKKYQITAEAEVAKAVSNLEQLEQAGKRVGDGIAKGAGTGARGLDGLAGATDQATRRAEAQATRMVQSVEREIARLKTVTRGDYLAELSKQRGTDSDPRVSRLIAEYKELEQAQLRAAASGARVGITAKQSAAALQQVPAQVTDIVTSLAAGQNPMLVLLQQGGQLKDQFGGVGAAARGIGGYVLGLVNPLTAAAAAAAGIGLVLYNAENQAKAFSRALVESGNSLGVTAGRLQGITQQLSAAGLGPQSRIAEVLTGVVNSSGIAASSLARVTEAAVLMERSGGQAAEKTVEQFAALAKEPTKAAAELAERTNFLTGAVYSQIKALEDQGKQTEAAALAMNAYAAAIESRAPQMVATLGTVERAWQRIRDQARNVIEDLLKLGRGQTIEEVLGGVKKKIAELEANPEARRGTLRGDADRRAALSSAKEQASILESDLRQMGRMAEAAGRQRDIARATVGWEKQGDEVASRRAKREDEIAKTKALGLAAGRSEAEIAERVAAVRAKYKDPGGSRAGGNGTDPLAELRARVTESALYADALRTQGLEAEKSTRSERELLVVAAQFTDKIKPKTAALLTQKLALLSVAATNERFIETQKKALQEEARAREESDRRIAQSEAVTAAAQARTDALRTMGLEALKLNDADFRAIALQKELAGTLTAAARAQKERELAAAQSEAQALRDQQTQQRRQESIKQAADQYANLVAATNADADAIAERAAQLEAANAVSGRGKSAVEELTLALLRQRLALADSSDAFPEQYVAGLQRAVDAQERLVAGQRTAEFKPIALKNEEALRAANDAFALQQDEFALLGLSNAEREQANALRAIALKLAAAEAEIERSTGSEVEKRVALENARLAAGVERMNVQAKAVQKQWTEVGDAIRGSFESAFAAVATGSKTGKEAFRDFANAIINEMVRIAAQNLAKSIFGGSDGGGEGWLSALLKVVGLFGGSSTTVTGATGDFARADRIATPMSIGTNYVPRDMLAYVHEGEAVVPKAYNPAAGGQKAANGDVYITNNTPAAVSAQRDSSGDWQIVIDEAVRRSENRIAGQIASGNGSVAQAMRSRGIGMNGGLARRA